MLKSGGAPSVRRRVRARIQHQLVAPRRWSPEQVDLAIEALTITNAALSRLMRLSGFTSNEVEGQSKRVRRLADRLEARAVLRDDEIEFIAGALAAIAILHRTAGSRCGARGAVEAEAFERASKAFSPAAVAAREPHVLWPDQAWRVGDSVIEIATGATWWIDEHDVHRPDLIGVIRDVGPVRLQWLPKAAFRRPGAVRE